MEFSELEISGRHEWLYERYSEFRKMTKVLLKQVLRGDNGGIDWFDTILTLGNLVGNFNLATTVDQVEANSEEDIEAPKAGDTIIPLCITDLLKTLLFSKVDQTVEKYLHKISQTVLSTATYKDSTSISDLLEIEI